MKKNMSVLLTAVLVMSLTACGSSAGIEAGGGNVINLVTSQPVVKATALSFTPEASDTDASWDASAAQIALTGASAKVTGSGASVKGGVVTVTSPGVYVVSGTLSDGHILISATKNDEVRLILNGVNITNKTGAAIYADKAAKLTVTLADGSENFLTDGGQNYIVDAEEEPNAALFVKNDLVINGTGALTVNANYKNGIGAKDTLLIVGGDITVDAEKNALRGTDGVTVLGGTFNLTAGNDGLQTGTNEEGKGNILLEGGVFNIVSAFDGIQSDNALTVTGGEYNIKAGGGAGASGADSAESYKGIKAASDIVISGGTFNLDSADDSIHSNGDISISGGVFNLTTGDDGVHTDTELRISGGEFNIPRSYEALEGNNIYITDGNFDLVSSDDAINAAGGSADGAAGGFGFGPFGRDMFNGGGDHVIDVSGGTINFYAGGDGFDSNGSINISGGTVSAIINSSIDNAALDCDGELTITGGTVVAGGTGAFERLSGSSTQSYVYMTNIAAGSELTVNYGGKTLASYTTDRALASVAIFAPGITAGQNCEVTVNGTATTVSAGTGGGGFGGMGGFGRQGQDGRGQGGFDRGGFGERRP
jgi:hypothetical protein